MQAGERVGIFLKRKLEETKSRRSHVAKETGISPYAVNSIYKNNQNNISLKTVLKLANYYNCSTDEVLGRNSFIDSNNNVYQSITTEEAMNKIRNFIKIKFDESGDNIRKFSKNCGFEEGGIREFIKDGIKAQNILSHNILIIADHFNISIDEMIGRRNDQNIVISNNKVSAIKTAENPNKPKDISQKLPAKDAAILNEIQQEIKEFQNEIKQKVNAINGGKSKVKDSSQSR